MIYERKPLNAGGAFVLLITVGLVGFCAYSYYSAHCFRLLLDGKIGVDKILIKDSDLPFARTKATITDPAIIEAFQSALSKAFQNPLGDAYTPPTIEAQSEIVIKYRGIGSTRNTILTISGDYGSFLISNSDDLGSDDRHFNTVHFSGPESQKLHDALVSSVQR